MYVFLMRHVILAARSTDIAFLLGDQNDARQQTNYEIMAVVFNWLAMAGITADALLYSME
jgi:hypothetical protein